MSEPFKQLPWKEVPEAPRLPHRFFETPHRTVTVSTEALGDVETHVRVTGDGPPLLLVHGLMTAGYSWRYCLEPLGKHFTLYIPDLPGSGRTAKVDRDYHPDHVADWIGALMTTLDIRGAPVIGNSMGGYLCLRLALRQPDAMSRLVNLHSPGVPLFRLHALRAALSLPGSYWLLRALVHAHPEYWVFKNVHYYDETLKSREESREYAEPLSTAAGVRAFGRILYETMAPGPMRAFGDQLEARRDLGERFPIPVQLVYSEQDPVVPAWVGDELARLLPHAEFVRLKRASHFAHVDATDRFVDAVLPFLQR